MSKSKITSYSQQKQLNYIQAERLRKHYQIERTYNINNSFVTDWKLSKTMAFIKDNNLYDTDYYREQNTSIDIKLKEIDAIEHYLKEGAWQGLDLHPLFDTDYYLEQNPRLEVSRINPLVHYLESDPSKQSNPHPLFQTDYYLERNRDLAGANINPLVHYILYGAGEGRNPHPLFDSRYYLERNPDVARSNINPLIHYLRYGARENRDPHPLFNTRYYLEQNPEVLELNINPLIYYLQYGAWEEYSPHPLFDHQYYLAENPDVLESNINPLLHYIRHGAEEHRNPHPLFDVGYYLENNPQLSALKQEPLTYYFRQGAFEGNLAWKAEKLRSVLNQSDFQEKNKIGLLLGGFQDDNITRSDPVMPKIGVYCSTEGNYFMTEIADLIADGFRRIGAGVVRFCENDFHSKDTDYDIVVAPHEFFYLGEGRRNWGEDFQWLSRTVMINVEQPQTSWFSKSFHFLKQAGLVLDINIKTATFLRRIGLPAYFLPLGYLPEYNPFSFCSQRPDMLALKSIPEHIWSQVDSLDASWRQRPIDILFVGYLSERRKLFFSRNASWLNKYKCFLHIPPSNGPFLQGRGNALSTQAFAGLSQRSKILLNIHQSDLDYFEWHRIIFYGLWQKTLVLTETCHQIPGLVPGKHYLQCELKDMSSKVEWLLHTKEGQDELERIRINGYNFLGNYLDLERITCRTLSLIRQSIPEYSL